MSFFELTINKPQSGQIKCAVVVGITQFDFFMSASDGDGLEQLIYALWSYYPDKINLTKWINLKSFYGNEYP